MKTKKRKTTKITVPTALALICCFAVILIINNQPTENTAKDEIISLKDIPDYSGSAFIEINGNEPYFSDDDYTTSSFEYYADLDEFRKMRHSLCLRWYRYNADRRERSDRQN